MKLRDPGLLREAASVGGRWIEAETNRAGEVRDPATDELVGRVPKPGTPEAVDAIEVARKAQAGWAAADGEGRQVSGHQAIRLMSSVDRKTRNPRKANS